MHDFIISCESFASTEETIEAKTSKGLNLLGQMYGRGCISLNMKKSSIGDFITFVKRKGYTIV